MDRIAERMRQLALMAVLGAGSIAAGQTREVPRRCGKGRRTPIRMCRCGSSEQDARTRACAPTGRSSWRRFPARDRLRLHSHARHSARRHGWSIARTSRETRSTTSSMWTPSTMRCCGFIFVRSSS